MKGNDWIALWVWALCSLGLLLGLRVFDTIRDRRALQGSCREIIGNGDKAL